MIDILGYTCATCGAAVDVRDGGKTQIWTCGHDGGIINANLKGTLFKRDGSVADADLPSSHRDAFLAQYGDQRFIGDKGEVRHDMKHWFAYIDAYHANPENGTRVGRFLAAMGTVLQRAKIVPPRVYACEACGRGVTVYATGKIDRPCGHHNEPIIAKISAGLTGTGGVAVNG